MSQQIDLKELERQVYRSNFQDGLWDIFLGLLLLQMVGAILYRQGWSPLWILLVMAGYVGLGVVGFKAAKKYVILPRMGLVHFGPERDKKKKKLSLVLSLSILAGVIVLAALLLIYNFVVNNPAPAVPQYGWLIFSGVFLAVSVIAASVIGYLTDFPRAVLYGWFFGLAFPLNIWLDNQFGITFPLATVLFAAIMIAIGLILFVRFLQRHPLSPQDTI